MPRCSYSAHAHRCTRIASVGRDDGLCYECRKMLVKRVRAKVALEEKHAAKQPDMVACSDCGKQRVRQSLRRGLCGTCRRKGLSFATSECAPDPSTLCSVGGCERVREVGRTCIEHEVRFDVAPTFKRPRAEDFAENHNDPMEGLGE